LEKEVGKRRTGWENYGIGIQAAFDGFPKTFDQWPGVESTIASSEVRGRMQLRHFNDVQLLNQFSSTCQPARNLLPNRFFSRFMTLHRAANCIETTGSSNYGRLSRSRQWPVKHSNTDLPSGFNGFLAL